MVTQSAIETFGSATYRHNSTIPRLQVMHAYEIGPFKDKRGVDLVSDALPFGGLCYTKPDDGNRVREVSQPIT